MKISTYKSYYTSAFGETVFKKRVVFNKKILTCKFLPQSRLVKISIDNFSHYTFMFL
jgi:hypothetical protein